MLTNESVTELKGILEKDTGVQISQKQARKFGEWILKFYSHLGTNKVDKTNPFAKNIK